MLAIIIIICLIILIGVVYQQRSKPKRKNIDSTIQTHLGHIRKNQVLIKPDLTANTFSGKFAGRLLRFSFGQSLTIHCKLTVPLEDEDLWIYPMTYPHGDKLRAKLEQHRVWAGKQPFDDKYYVAGRPRHFAYAVIHPARHIQNRLLAYPNSVITTSEQDVICQPNIKSLDQLDAEDWYELMSLVADVAEYIEAQFEAEMFSGITIDEQAYPDHSSGHVN